MKIELYRELEIPFGAGKDAIVSAYRRLVKIYHPDLHPGDIHSEERMKRINAAYSELSHTDKHDYSSEKITDENNEKAIAAINAYFDAIMQNDPLKAFSYVSEYDKQYVTVQSFIEWRESVSRLFKIESYICLAVADTTTLRKSVTSVGKKVTVRITERNRLTGENEHFHTAKDCILENGEWRVMLGYRDLNEIARVFENLSAKYETNDMQKHWEEYCSDNCRELGILSKSGLLKKVEIEIYRSKRFKQPLIAAVYILEITENSEERILSKAAEVIRSTIRATDICAYLGGGVFAVLYVGLKKRNAAMVTSRLGLRLELLAPTATVYEQFAEKEDFEPMLRRIIGNRV